MSAIKIKKPTIDEVKESGEFKALLQKSIHEHNEFWYGVIIHWKDGKVQRYRVNENEGPHNMKMPIVKVKYSHSYDKNSEIIEWY